MLLVYCDHITPRIEYIFQFILDTVCGFQYQLTTDERWYREYTGATLNYSHKTVKQADIEIKPNGLLQLQTVRDCKAIVKQENGQVQLFLKAAGIDTACFDLFAASFFLITRYEEYLNFVPDKHNRFEAAASILYKHKLLERPLVDEWAAALKQTILKAHAHLPVRKNIFTCKITIDVDQAFAFKHRSFLKNGFAFSKNLLNLNSSFLQSQLRTFIFNDRDPYDTFSYLKQVQHESALPFIYFINAGINTTYDKNLPVTNTYFKQLLNQLKSYAAIGLHPSYFSDVQPEKLKAEKMALEAAINQPITKSRQHYLKLYFPQSYRQLVAHGITEDYTMGYASHPGFRAGTCTPFQWFDLQENKVMPLTVFPITYMEGSYGEDLKMQPEQASTEMKTLTDTVKRYNGCHISIWHNHTVNDRFFWRGWKAVFEETLHYIAKNLA